MDGRGKGYVKSKGMEFFCLFLGANGSLERGGEEAVEISGRRIHTVPYTGTTGRGRGKTFSFEQY